MTRIIVIVLSTISAGELTISYEFIQRLPSEKYSVHYIIPQKFAEYLSSKNIAFITLDEKSTPEKNKEKAMSFIQRFSPNYFIVSDVFTMGYAALWSGLKFCDIKGLAPIIGVDEYEFQSTNYSIDYYGLFFEKLPPLVDACDYVIRDCPINAPRVTDHKIKHFSLYDRIPKMNKETKTRMKEALGLTEGEKVIFFTTSSWELLNMHKLTSLNALIRHIPNMLKHYLYQLDQKITIIHVGHNPWGKIENSNINYLHFETLLPSDFENYLLLSDMFITFNIVSVTLTKAIYAGIPSVVLQNYKIIDFSHLEKRVRQLPLWYQAMAKEVKRVYPFRASTFGWYKFIEPVLTNNLYTTTFVEVPFFNMKKVVDTFNDYLNNQKKIHTLCQAQHTYVEEILKLPTPEQIMDEIIEDEKKEGIEHDKGNTRFII